MVCLLHSKLFRETKINKEDFETVFGHPYEYILTSPSELLPFLEICNFFLIDCPPFDELWSFRINLLTMEYEIPPHLLFLYDAVYVAFFGNLVDVIKTGDKDIFIWVHHHRLSMDEEVFTKLLDRTIGHNEEVVLELFHLLYLWGKRPHGYCLELALQQNKIKIAYWLLFHQIDLTCYHMSVAIQHSGDIDFLELMVKKQCPICSHSVAVACAQGRLDIVQWWDSKKFPFCEKSTAWAALFGHIQVLQYLLQTRKPLNYLRTLINAEHRGDETMISLIKNEIQIVAD